MTDDGLGVLAAQELGKKAWPPEVRILEAGTSALLFLEEIGRSQNVIIVDAVQRGEEPGSVYSFRIRDFSCAGEGWRDAHGLSPAAVIAMARELTGLPISMFVFGVEPGDLQPGTGLSPAVAGSLQRVVDRVAEEIIRILKDVPGRIILNRVPFNL